jgi:predicted permease
MIETKGITVLIDCYECKAKISDSAASCPQCGAIPLDPTQALPVEVSDFDMKFGSMFWFLIKLSFAAVPAVIVIYTAWTIIGGVMNPLLHM